VVVLGGNGFVGRHACAAFAAAGAQVTSVSRRPERLPHARSVAIDCAGGDIDAIAEMLADIRPSVIVNAAGAVWGVNDDELRASNVTLVTRLTAAIGRLPWRPRLVHLGSVHEYGAVTCPIREDAEPRPLSPYGRTKLLGTQAVLDAVAAGDCDATVLRIVNISGPGTPQRSLLGQVADQLAMARAAGRTAVLRLATLDAHRDFVDVRDIASAIEAAAVAPDATPVINIGRGEAVSVRWLVRELIAASGVPAELVEQDAPAREDRGSGVDALHIDATLARERLGWVARYPLSASLAALWSHVATPFHDAR
jgi:dTDP-6-deoxy-L-talose 4-dehydrogenase [NAD(P)+]